MLCLQLKRDLESVRAVAAAAQALAEDRITAAEAACHTLTSQLSAQTDTVLRLEVVSSELEAARADYLREVVCTYNSTGLSHLKLNSASILRVHTTVGFVLGINLTDGCCMWCLRSSIAMVTLQCSKASDDICGPPAVAIEVHDTHQHFVCCLD